MRAGKEVKSAFRRARHRTAVAAYHALCVVRRDVVTVPMKRTRGAVRKARHRTVVTAYRGIAWVGARALGALRRARYPTVTTYRAIPATPLRRDERPGSEKDEAGAERVKAPPDINAGHV